MSQRHNDRLERWVDLGSGGASSSSRHGIERRIGRVLARVPAPPALGRAAYARVEARLLKPEGRERTAGTGWFGRLAMGSGLGALSVLLSGAVIAAGGVGAWWKIAHSSAPPPSGAAVTRNEAPREARHRARPRLAARSPGAEAISEVAGEPVPATALLPVGESPSAVDPPPPAHAPSNNAEPAPATAPPVAPLSRPRAAAAPSSTGRRASAPAPTSTALAEETRLLGGALAALRQQHDGAAALASVNEYLGRFPNGTLLGEAQRARIDALLLLGRREDALHALDRLDIDPVGRGQELLLIRGELRARRDCADAIPDFDLVLGHSAPPHLAERALFGRAVCRQQEGRKTAARADALAYLERFPSGRFADAARRLAANGGISSPPVPPTERDGNL